MNRCFLNPLHVIKLHLTLPPVQNLSQNRTITPPRTEPQRKLIASVLSPRKAQLFVSNVEILATQPFLVATRWFVLLVKRLAIALSPVQKLPLLLNLFLLHQRVLSLLP